jgi:hypothetical protein
MRMASSAPDDGMVTCQGRHEKRVRERKRSLFVRVDRCFSEQEALSGRSTQNCAFAVQAILLYRLVRHHDEKHEGLPL